MDFASELAAKLGGAPVPKPASQPIDSGDEGSDEWGEEPAPKPPPISEWIFQTEAFLLSIMAELSKKKILHFWFLSL